MRRRKWTIGMFLFLGFILVAGYVNERRRDAAINDAAYKSCVRQNIHRNAHNRQTLILKGIMADVAKAQQNLADANRKGGDELAAQAAQDIADQWSSYEMQFYRVPIAPCRALYPQHNTRRER